MLSDYFTAYFEIQEHVCWKLHYLEWTKINLVLSRWASGLDGLPFILGGAEDSKVKANFSDSKSDLLLRGHPTRQSGSPDGAWSDCGVGEQASRLSHVQCDVTAPCKQRYLCWRGTAPEKRWVKNMNGGPRNGMKCSFSLVKLHACKNTRPTCASPDLNTRPTCTGVASGERAGGLQWAGLARALSTWVSEDSK